MVLPCRISVWDGGSTAPAEHRSGRDPINPIRIERLRRRGLTWREIGMVLAKEDGRAMAFTSRGVYHAWQAYERGERDDDGERPFAPARARKQRPISLSAGVGVIFKSALGR